MIFDASENSPTAEKWFLMPRRILRRPKNGFRGIGQRLGRRNIIFDVSEDSATPKNDLERLGDCWQMF
jgi:hypothetical protein